MAPADTIIKSVSERPNGMFPPGNHVRTCGTSVIRGSELDLAQFLKKSHFLNFFEKNQNFAKKETSPQTMAGVEIDIDSDEYQAWFIS